MIQLPTHEDMQLLIKAIEGLTPEANLIKEYIYPIALAFASALMGGLVGYLSLLRREHIESEKVKIDATNKLLLEAVVCFQDLQSIKQNYLGKLTGDPLQRAACIPPILGHNRSSNPELSGLYYLAKETTKIFNNRPIEDVKASYSNIALIMSLFSNYNTVIEMWRVRSEIALPIFERIVAANSNSGVADVGLSDVYKSIDPAKFAQFVDLNEKVIVATDDLLADFERLMRELPKIAGSLISRKVQSNYGDVFRPKFDPKILDDMLNQTPVDQVKLNKILGR